MGKVKRTCSGVGAINSKLSVFIDSSSLQTGPGQHNFVIVTYTHTQRLKRQYVSVEGCPYE